MFKFAKTTETPIQFKTPAGPETIVMKFRWLPVSERVAVLERHDAALAELPPVADPDSDEPVKPGKKAKHEATPTERMKSVAQIRAKTIMELAEGWEFIGDDGENVPWTQVVIADLLDCAPALWVMILEASGKATSVEAIEGN